MSAISNYTSDFFNYSGFVQNKYSSWYLDLIQSASGKNRKKGKDVYYENHHILPAKLFPEYVKESWNQVLLTAREHFIAHRLLSKFTKGSAYYKMAHAISAFVFLKEDRKLTSRQYEIIKIQLKGLKKTAEHSKNIAEALKGKPLTEERKQKISNTLKEKFESGELEPAFRGKTQSEESKQRHSDVMRGKQKGSKNGTFKGYYVTPWGVFESLISAVEASGVKMGEATLFNYCKPNNLKKLTPFSYRISKYFTQHFSPEIIGKSYKDIGFGFIPE